MAIYWVAVRASQSPTGQALIKKIHRDLEMAGVLSAAGAVILSQADRFIGWFTGDSEPAMFAEDTSCVVTTPQEEGLAGDSLEDLYNDGWQRMRKFGEGGEPIPY